MTAHEFGQGVDNNVGPMFDRPQQDRGRHSIVDDQRRPAHVRDVSERFDIGDIACRIADDSQKTARVVSSIKGAISSTRSLPAKRAWTPCRFKV